MILIVSSFLLPGSLGAAAVPLVGEQQHRNFYRLVASGLFHRSHAGNSRSLPRPHLNDDCLEFPILQEVISVWAGQAQAKLESHENAAYLAVLHAAEGDPLKLCLLLLFQRVVCRGFITHAVACWQARPLTRCFTKTSQRKTITQSAIAPWKRASIMTIIRI